MTRLFTRLLSAAALLLGTHAAAQAQPTGSGCTALYALTTSGIYFVSSTGQTSFVASGGGSGINGAALDPVDGNLYFIDRTNNGQNDLKMLNTDTGQVTPVAAVALPDTDAYVVGASFDNTGQLYLLYSNYKIQEIDKSTGLVSRTITINLPIGVFKVTETSGDMVFDGTTLYAVLDAATVWTNRPRYFTLGTIPATGTTITASKYVTLSAGGVSPGPVNGLAINPVPTPKVTYVTGGTTSYTLDTDTGVLTPTTGGGATLSYTDLSDCTVAPNTPVISKSFSNPTIRTNGSSVLTITVSNTNAGTYYTTAPIVDTFPSGLVVASTPNLSTTCKLADGTAATATGAAGATSVSLPANLRIPGPGSCTLTVTVTGTSRGEKPNTIAAGNVNTTAGNPQSDATATLLVNDPITGTNVKRQRLYPNGTLGTADINAKPKDLVEYCITATHSGIGYAPATTANITDTLNTNLSFVTGSATQGYGVGQDLKITRNNGTPTYRAYGSTVNGQKLTVDIAPFDSSNSKVEVCFIAQVK